MNNIESGMNAQAIPDETKKYAMAHAKSMFEHLESQRDRARKMVEETEATIADRPEEEKADIREFTKGLCDKLLKGVDEFEKEYREYWEEKGITFEK